jgi:hypothetical protein
LEKGKTMRIIGVELANARRMAATANRDSPWLQSALEGTNADRSAFPTPQMTAVPVYGDDDGSQFVMHPSPSGFVPVPYACGSPLNLEQENAAEGGFIATGDLESFSAQSPPGGGGPLPGPMLGAAAMGLLSKNDPQIAAAMDAINRDRFGTSPRNAERRSAEPSPGSAAPQSSAETPASQSASDSEASQGGGSAGGAPSLFSAMGQQLGTQALGYLASGATLNNTVSNIIGNIPGLGMMLAGQFVGQQIQGLFDRWQLDDESSTGEHAAKAAAQMVANKVQSELMSMIASQLLPGAKAPQSLLDKIRDFFVGVPSSAVLKAAHFGTPDDQGNTAVAATATTVFVNGQRALAAKSADLMAPANKMVLDGSTSVLLGRGKFMFARETSKTAVPSTLKPGSPNVLIGGTAPNPVAPNAAAVSKEDALALAEQAYKDGKKGLLSNGKPPETMPNEFTAPSGETYRVVAVNDADLDPSLPDGYRSVLFQRVGDDQPVLVFCGTNMDSMADWANNIAQGFGFVPGQYQQALLDAQRCQTQYPNLFLVGHSLGGGLASFASGMTGAPMIGFNSAGLGAGSMAMIAANGLPISPEQMNQYLVRGEILSDYSTYVGQPADFGRIYTLEGDPNHSAIENHQVEIIRDYGMKHPISGPESVDPRFPPVYYPA